jgi:hypothetical protein
MRGIYGISPISLGRSHVTRARSGAVLQVVNFSVDGSDGENVKKFFLRSEGRASRAPGRERTSLASKSTCRSCALRRFLRFEDSVLFALDKPTRRRALAALAGALAFPGLQAAAEAGEAALEPAAVPGDLAPAGDAKAAPPSATCLAETICALKKSVRWKVAAWSPSFCQRIAKGVLSASAKYDLPPALLLSIMLNESDLNEKAVATYYRGGTVYAHDTGLMGIRCVVDGRNRCKNGNVKGIAWKTVKDPVKNIELGARELAHWRDGGGVTKGTVRKRGPDGKIATRTRWVRCKHLTHAYWAHYNHGPRYIDHGYARHYPHRVAVLYRALASVLNVPAPELESKRITINDPGQRPRTADRPVEVRYRVLCDKIRSLSGACSSSVAAATMPAPRAN